MKSKLAYNISSRKDVVTYPQRLCPVLSQQHDEEEDKGPRVKFTKLGNNKPRDCHIEAVAERVLNIRALITRPKNEYSSGPHLLYIHIYNAMLNIYFGIYFLISSKLHHQIIAKWGKFDMYDAHIKSVWLPNRPETFL